MRHLKKSYILSILDLFIKDIWFSIKSFFGIHCNMKIICYDIWFILTMFCFVPDFYITYQMDLFCNQVFFSLWVIFLKPLSHNIASLKTLYLDICIADRPSTNLDLIHLLSWSYVSWFAEKYQFLRFLLLTRLVKHIIWNLYTMFLTTIHKSG